MNTYFVTGTDTEVGKTFVSTLLLQRAHALGYKTVAFKPVAAGADRVNGDWRNEDGLALQGAINQPIPYQHINPLCLPEAIAPHIAAEINGVDLSVETLLEYFKTLGQYSADFCIVEGAGGWKVPLNQNESFADLAVALQLPVILVVAMRLGCINHALLTVESVKASGLRLAGWVANQVTQAPMSFHTENISYLKGAIDAPFLGEVPHVTADGEMPISRVRLPAGLEQPDNLAH